MRYSKILLVLALSFVMIFGGMIGSFAEDESLQAIPFPPGPFPSFPHPLTVEVNNSDMGDVEGTLPGSYAENYPITETAVPADGHSFAFWFKNGHYYSSSEVIGLPMPNNDLHLKAIFYKTPQITTSVEPEGAGTVEGAGFYKIGAHVVLTATPARGYLFDHWVITDDCEEPEIPDMDRLFTPEPEFVRPPNNVKHIEMGPCDIHVKAVFVEREDLFKVTLEADPEEGGNPDFVAPDYDGMYYTGESFKLEPNPNPHFSFTGWTYEEDCDEPEIGLLKCPPKLPPIYVEETDTFTMHYCDLIITGHYEEDPFVLATIQYHNTVGGSIKPDDTNVKVYLDEPYNFAPPAISGYQHIYSSPNKSGTLTEGAENFIVTHVYQVPPTPQVITNTVTETVFVNVPVPATTAAPTTEVIPTEAVPLGAVTVMNFDEIFADEEPVIVEEPIPVIVDEEETPLADALPQTGQLPVELFYGIGGLVSTIGLYIRRKR